MQTARTRVLIAVLIATALLLAAPVAARALTAGAAAPPAASTAQSAPFAATGHANGTILDEVGLAVLTTIAGIGFVSVVFFKMRKDR